MVFLGGKIDTEIFTICNIYQHDVVAMRGDNARKLFFVEKGLGFLEGYMLLVGSVSDLRHCSAYREC